MIDVFQETIRNLKDPSDPTDAVNKKYVDAFRQVGDIKMSIQSSDHHFWMLCDGRSLSTTLYADLFDVIGYSFGGCGSHFNLPNAAGRVLGVTGSAEGLTTRETGDAVGEERHSMNESELPAHSHTGTTASSGSHNHSGSSGAAGAHNHGGSVSNNGSHNHGGTTSAEGSHTHSVNDPGHTHTQWTINDDFNSSGASPPGFAADSAGYRTWNNINSSYTGISVSSSGNHDHTISSDGTHSHTITSENNHQHSISSDGSHTHNFQTGNTGSGNAFNVMQPTLFIGNTFIFSGIR
jgi:microcystin-dependent protein